MMSGCPCTGSPTLFPLGRTVRQQPLCACPPLSQRGGAGGGVSLNQACIFSSPPLSQRGGAGGGVSLCLACIRNLPSPFPKGGARGGVSLSQAVNPQPSFALIGAKVPLRGTYCLACCDQAACISDALAWSFEQNRVSDPLCIFDAQLHTRNRRRVILNEDGRLPSPFPKGRGRGWGFPLPGEHPQPPLPFGKGR